MQRFAFNAPDLASVTWVLYWMPDRVSEMTVFIGNQQVEVSLLFDGERSELESILCRCTGVKVMAATLKVLDNFD